MDIHDAQREAGGRSPHGWTDSAVASRPLTRDPSGPRSDAGARDAAAPSAPDESVPIEIPVVPEGAVLPRLDRPPRRVLFFGKSKSRSRCTGALVDALERNGLEVRWRSIPKLRRWMGRRLALDFVRREFARFRPDLVFVFFMDLPEVLLDQFQGRTTLVVAHRVLLPRLVAAYTAHLDWAPFTSESSARRMLGISLAELAGDLRHGERLLQALLPGGVVGSAASSAVSSVDDLVAGAGGLVGPGSVGRRPL